MRQYHSHHNLFRDLHRPQGPQPCPLLCMHPLLCVPAERPLLTPPGGSPAAQGTGGFVPAVAAPTSHTPRGARRLMLLLAGPPCLYPSLVPFAPNRCGALKVTACLSSPFEVPDARRRSACQCRAALPRPAPPDPALLCLCAHFTRQTIGPAGTLDGCLPCLAMLIISSLTASHSTPGRLPSPWSLQPFAYRMTHVASSLL